MFTLSGTAQAQDNEKVLAAVQAGDYAAALQEWRPLAEQGGANAQFNLGVMYLNGGGVSQDYKEAANWYRKSAEQGDSQAQTNSDFMYLQGYGVLQVNSLAHMWF